MQIGAAVASIRYANFAREMRLASVTGIITERATGEVPILFAASPFRATRSQPSDGSMT